MSPNQTLMSYLICGREQEKTLQEEVKQEQLRSMLLQHSLDDRLAQLRLEEVAVQVRSSSNHCPALKTSITSQPFSSITS